MFTSPGTRAGRGESLGFWSKLFDRLFGSSLGNIITRKAAGWRSGTIADISPLTTKGDLFAFGTSNTRLPAGTNGQAVVYDSAQTIGITPANTVMDLRYGVFDQDDFLYDVFSLGANLSIHGFKTGYVTSGSATITAGILGQGPGMQGVVRLQTGLTNNSWCVAQGLIGPSTLINGTSLILGDGTLEVTWWFKTDTVLSNATDRYLLRFGVADGNISPANEIVAQYRDDINGGKFTISVLVGGASASASGTTALIAATKYRVRLVISAGQVLMYLAQYGGAETLEATFLGSLPATTSALGPYASILKQAGSTNSRSVYIDAWQFNYAMTANAR